MISLRYPNHPKIIMPQGDNPLPTIPRTCIYCTHYNENVECGDYGKILSWEPECEKENHLVIFHSEKGDEFDADPDFPYVIPPTNCEFEVDPEIEFWNSRYSARFPEEIAPQKEFYTMEEYEAAIDAAWEAYKEYKEEHP